MPRQVSSTPVMICLKDLLFKHTGIYSGLSRGDTTPDLNALIWRSLGQYKSTDNISILLKGDYSTSYDFSKEEQIHNILDSHANQIYHLG